MTSQEIRKEEYGICQECRKNKAVMIYADGYLEYAHGFTLNICQECYDKKMKNNEWYKKGYEKGKIEETARILELLEQVHTEFDLGKLRLELKSEIQSQETKPKGNNEAQETASVNSVVRRDKTPDTHSQIKKEKTE